MSVTISKSTAVSVTFPEAHLRRALLEYGQRQGWIPTHIMGTMVELRDATGDYPIDNDRQLRWVETETIDDPA